MSTTTLSTDARSALGSACAEVVEGVDADAVDGVPAGLVARPADTDQVAAVLAAAAAHGLSVVPRGRGTKISWGVAPTSADVVLDLSALDRVLDHAAGELIVDTQAGATLASLQETVAAGDQRLVLDETVPGASIGGVLATNSSGPQRMLVGTPRDLLIGITVVRADGVVAHAGGRVVKNVAGYDLGKLMIGSYGTLGVITEAVFRLHPEPEARRWVCVEVGDPAAAHTASQAVVHSQVMAHAVEVDLDASGAGEVQVLLGGREGGVEERARTVRELLGAGADTRHSAPDGFGTLPWQLGETGLKLTCVLSAVGDVLGVAREVGARVRGSAGTGVLQAAVAEGTDVGHALDRLRTVCGQHHGTVVVVDAPAEVKRDLDVWGPVPGLDLMRRVKDRFDPDHRLAPGRFVGGI